MRVRPVSHALLFFFAPSLAAAATLTVGPGQMYATPCAAIAAASPGDEIDISAGTYTDTCAIDTAGLHLKGVGGRPKIDVTGEEPAQSKGIYAIEADDVIIENLELTGAQISSGEGENGAGLRIQSNGVVVTNCYIHDNQDGILSGPVTGAGTGTQTIEHTEFANNGLGNGCNDGNGCTHNAYIGPYAHLVYQFNWSHDVGSDGGHLLKSRAVRNDILYNRLTGQAGDDSYELEIAQGGVGIVVGNVLEKGPNSQNTGTSLFFCDPGDGCASPGTSTLYAANNTFVNDSSGNTTFINVGGGATLASAHDNIFYGMGTPSSTGALSTDNLTGTNPEFVDAGAFDYHLQSTSPGIGKGVPEGTADGFSLVPVFEYVDPVSAVVRTAASDLGAFEYGTNLGNPSLDAGAETADGGMIVPEAGAGGGDAGGGSGPGSSSGTGTGMSSGTGTGGTHGSGSGSGGKHGGTGTGSSGGSSQGDGGAGGGASAGNSGGCSCTMVGGDGSPAPEFLALLGSVIAWAGARRRRRR